MNEKKENGPWPGGLTTDEMAEMVAGAINSMHQSPEYKKTVSDAKRRHKRKTNRTKKEKKNEQHSVSN